MGNFKLHRLNCNRDSVLVCGRNLDGFNQAVRTDRHNVLFALPAASAYSQLGRLFAVSSTGVLSQESGISQFLFISNPANSGRIMYLNTVSGGGMLSPPEQPLSYESTLQITLIRNPEFEVTQTLAIHNLNFGSADTSAMMAGINTIQIGGDIVTVLYQNLHSFQLNFNGEVVLPPGSTMALHFVASGLFLGNPDSLVFGATATWYEPDLP